MICQRFGQNPSANAQKFLENLKDAVPGIPVKSIEMRIVGACSLTDDAFQTGCKTHPIPRNKGVTTLLCKAPSGPFRQKSPEPFFSAINRPGWERQATAGRISKRKKRNWKMAGVEQAARHPHPPQGRSRSPTGSGISRPSDRTRTGPRVPEHSDTSTCNPPWQSRWARPLRQPAIGPVPPPCGSVHSDW